MNNKGSVVVLLSGGIDSAVCASYLVEEGFDVHALTFATTKSGLDSAEVSCAKKTAKSLGLKHIVLDISSLDLLVSDVGGMNTFIGGKLGGCCPIDAKASPMSVEMMHLAAFMYAISHDIKSVYWALHRDDIGVNAHLKVSYYLEMVESIARLNYDAECQMKIPFLTMTKLEVVSLGLSLGLDTDNTYSCSSGDDISCGKCEQCLLREAALASVKSVVASA